MNARRRLALAVLALDGVEQRRSGIQIERIAVFVRLGRRHRLHAGRLFPRVVTAEAALAERSEQIAQRAVAEKIERLVGDLEGDRRRLPPRALPSLAPLALGIEIGRCGDVALLRHPFDDLLNELLE